MCGVCCGQIDQLDPCCWLWLPIHEQTSLIELTLCHCVVTVTIGLISQCRHSRLQFSRVDYLKHGRNFCRVCLYIFGDEMMILIKFLTSCQNASNYQLMNWFKKKICRNKLHGTFLIHNIMLPCKLVEIRNEVKIKNHSEHDWDWLEVTPSQTIRLCCSVFCGDTDGQSYNVKTIMEECFSID